MICNGIPLDRMDVFMWLLMLVLGTWKCIDLINKTPKLVDWITRKIEGPPLITNSLLIDAGDHVDIAGDKFKVISKVVSKDSYGFKVRFELQQDNKIDGSQ